MEIRLHPCPGSPTLTFFFAHKAQWRPRRRPRRTSPSPIWWTWSWECGAPTLPRWRIVTWRVAGTWWSRDTSRKGGLLDMEGACRYGVFILYIYIYTYMWVSVCVCAFVYFYSFICLFIYLFFFDDHFYYLSYLIYIMSPCLHDVICVSYQSCGWVSRNMMFGTWLRLKIGWFYHWSHHWCPKLGPIWVEP